jgi:hypothetical protein
VILVHALTGIQARVGDTLHTFRSEPVRLTQIELPKSENSSGRIYVEFAGRSASFYPGVCGLEWRQSP